MTQHFFAIAQVAHEVTLWLLITLSVLSLAFILERFIVLTGIRRESGKISGRLREVLQLLRIVLSLLRVVLKGWIGGEVCSAGVEVEGAEVEIWIIGDVDVATSDVSYGRNSNSINVAAIDITTG